MKSFFKKALIYSLAVTMILPSWLAVTVVTAKHAYAAMAVSGGGSTSTVGGLGTFTTLDPLVITSEAAGDITSAGVIITVTSRTQSALNFNLAAPVNVTPSSGLDLGPGPGNAISVTPTATQIMVPVLTPSSAAGDSITVSNIQVAATADGVSTDYAGDENLIVGVESGDLIHVDTQKPSVNLTSTVSGATSSATIPVTAIFSENVSGFSDSDLVVTNGTVANLNSSDPAHYTFDVTPLVEGPVTVDVLALAATDVVGNSNVASDQFSVIYDVTAPTVLDVTSGDLDKAYKANDVIDISIRFNENIVVTGTPMVLMNTGNVTSQFADYEVGSGTNTLHFNYTVTSGDNISDLDYFSVDALSLGAAEIEDEAGNSADLDDDGKVTLPAPAAAGSLGANKNITLDTIVPAVPVLNHVVSPRNAANETISGTAEANSLITIAGGASTVTEQLNGGNTDFSIVVPLVRNATNTLVVTSTDAAGNVSPVVNAVIVEDSTNPPKPIVDPFVYPAGISSIIVTGTTEANALIAIDGQIDDVTQQLTDGNNTFSLAVQLKPNQINTLAVVARDATGNLSDPTVVIVNPVMGSHQAVVSNDGFTGILNINIPSTVPNATLDLSSLTPTINADGTKSVTTTATLSLNSLASSGNVLIKTVIPAGTIFTGPGTWDGILNAIQTRVATSIVPTVDTDKSATNVAAWEIGLGDSSVIFSNPVKLVFVGQAGKTVGYYRSNVFTPITNVCDSLVSPTINGNGECRGVSGNDLVVWTKHLTQFITYDQAYLPLTKPQVTVTKMDGGDKIIRFEWFGVGRGVERYNVFVNGILVAAKVSTSSIDSSSKYVYDAKVADFGKYNVYVRAVRGSDSTQSDVATIEFTQAVSATTQSLTSTPVSTYLAPTKAEAKEPAVETPSPVTETANADDQGVIAGSNEDSKENINWTPWIILFVLIILAGAATGGYFFWFGGEEELETATAATPVKTETTRTKKAEPTVSKKQNAKKEKRW